MDEPDRSVVLAWLWVIEYIASLREIDPSILHALIDVAPELPEDLGKETREMVALRCMEHLFGSRNEVESNVSSTAMPKITFDISRSCEDVLLSILKETDFRRSGTDLLKWDIQPFLVHKKTSMPKCSLERLKYALLEGTHSFAASLIVPSGLMYKDEDKDQSSTDCFQQNVGCRIDSAGTSNTVAMAQEGSTTCLPLENNFGSLDGDSLDQTLLPMKRNGNVLDNGNQADYPKDQGDVGDGDLHLNVKRFKCNVSSANETTEQILTPQVNNELVEESFKRMTETTGKESSHAERESRVEGVGEQLSPENGHKKFVATDRNVRRDNPDAMYEIKHYQCHNADDSTKMPQDTFGDESCRDIMAGEVNEVEIRNGTSSGRILQKVSIDDSKDNCNGGNQQKSPIDVSSSGFPRENTVGISEDGSKCFYEEDPSSDGDEYRHENVDVAVEKSKFLSSQCTLSHVSLSRCTELNLCVKCSKDGQLLVCDAVGCPMVVHKKCLGYSPGFDNNGNFICAFCAYSFAISEYMEAKARAASARKELARFIHKGFGRSHGKKHDNVKQKVRVEESDQTNERHDNNQLEKIKVENKFEEPLISCTGRNLMQREEEPDVTHRMSPISPAEKETEGVAPEHLSLRGLDMQDHVSFDPKFNIAKRLCRDKEIPVNGKGGGTQKEVFGQLSNDLLEKPVCAVNSDGGKTTNVKAKEDKVCNYSTRLQGTKKQFVSPGKYKRNKPERVPWTAEEERMLKEGVKKFSRMGEGFPWKKILEYGSSVFWSGCTTIDLKEKWTKMERKS